MIISCPECAGPFEIPDDHIAALTQVACPHCAFRMILDFAAANDPSLVEPGMQMASGFLSAADYYASTRPATAPATPVVTEVPEAAEATAGTPEPEPERPAARITPTRPPVHATPTTSPPSRPPVQPETRTPDLSISAPSAPPLRKPGTEATPEPVTARRPAPADLDEEAPTIAPGQYRLPPGGLAALRADSPVEPEPPAEPEVEPEATPAEQEAHPTFSEDDEDMPTMVVPPEARRKIEAEVEKANEAAAAQAAEAARAARADRAARESAPQPAPEAAPTPEPKPAPKPAPTPEPTPEPEAEASPAERERVPPHTPPGRAKPKDDEAARAEPRPPKSTEDARPKRSEPRPASERLETFDDPSLDGSEKKMSTLGLVLVVLFLLLAIGLVGASMALEGTPDPRPLLEKLYRQNVGSPADTAR